MASRLHIKLLNDVKEHPEFSSQKYFFGALIKERFLIFNILTTLYNKKKEYLIIYINFKKYLNNVHIGKR
jgi:hypothetical protein